MHYIVGLYKNGIHFKNKGYIALGKLLPATGRELACRSAIKGRVMNYFKPHRLVIYLKYSYGCRIKIDQLTVVLILERIILNVGQLK